MYNRHQECLLSDLLSKVTSIEDLINTKCGVTFEIMLNTFFKTLSLNLFDKNAFISNEQNISMEFFAKIIQMVYGENQSSKLILNYCILVPINDNKERAIDEEEISLTAKAKREAANNELHLMTETSMESNRSYRIAKEFKLKLYDQGYPEIVMKLNYIMLFLIFFLTIITSIFFYKDRHMFIYSL